MKAIICDSFGPANNLKFIDVEEPTISDDDVKIIVHACSVNFPDTLIIQGKYQIKADFPFSPGSDIAGIVESVGKNVKHIKPGDEVIAFIPYGGFAEKATAHKSACFPKPQGMTMVNAAAFLLTYGTSFHALKDRAQLDVGETILVLGASGGVGLTAVELAKKMGAKVIAAASSKDKLALCKEYGADQTIQYNEEDLKTRVKALTQGKGVDVVYDPVGGQYSEQALRAMAWNGRYLVIGFANGEIPKIPLNLPLLKGCSIMGVFWGAFAQKEPQKNLSNTQQLLKWFNAKELNPHIDKVFPLKDAALALDLMQQRQSKGKLVISMI